MGVHKVSDTYGDNQLSSFERRLWNLTYYCLIKYGSPVMFNVYGPSAPKRIDQHIYFFVPLGDKFEEVTDFLLDELKDEIRDGEIINVESNPLFLTEPVIREEYLWGTKVDVLPCSGPEFYLENSLSRPIIAEAARKFMQYLEDRHNEPSKI
jgi:hypothetical protein